MRESEKEKKQKIKGKRIPWLKVKEGRGEKKSTTTIIITTIRRRKKIFE